MLRHVNQRVRSTLGRTPSPTPLPTRATSYLRLSGKDLEARKGKDSPLEKGVKRAQKHLFSRQLGDGSWEARLQDNITITAEYVMLLRFLGILDPDTARKAKETILQTQLPDGGWNIFGGGPSEHSATVEAYFALKLCGISSKHAALQKAKKLILQNGGIPATRVFTKIHLALFGQYPWSSVPIINPELMFLPRAAPLNIYEFSSWSRAVIIPLLIIFAQKPVASLAKREKIDELKIKRAKPRRRDQLFALLKEPPWDLERIFELAQNAIGLYEKMPIKPLRGRALGMAEKWILKHQEKDGSWGGIYPAMANAILALYLRGYKLEDPVLKKGLQALRSYAEESEKTFRMQSTVSPVWDTAITIYAMQESGMPCNDARIGRAVSYLLSKQILDHRGDWKHKARPTKPGGWPFEYENSNYPDVDDTALAILALLPGEARPEKKDEITLAVDRGIEWLLGMQGSDGGWGAFDRDNNRQILNQIPFADLKSLLDPSTPDVTGHALEALGYSGFERYSKPIDRAIDFLEERQEADGSWYGRWGVNYIYGTAAVLSGLAAAGENMKRMYVHRAHHWFATIQNVDGGWGESCNSYETNSYFPLGNSTPSQTAWALIGLLSCPTSSKKSIERGVRYLLQHQERDGGWTEPEWTGTGFPKHFYLRYDYYRLYFPLLALARYASIQKNGHVTKPTMMKHKRKE